MPTVNIWRGDAEARKGQWVLTIAEARAGAAYVVTVNGQPYEYIAEAGYEEQYTSVPPDTTADIAEALAELLGDQDVLDVSVNGSTLTLEDRVAGVDTVVTVSAPAFALVEVVRAGEDTINQEILLSIPQGTDGGTWTATFNFGSGSETTSAIAWNAAPSAVQSAIEALSTPGSGDVAVTLEETDPRTYRVELRGSLAGRNATASIDATALTGNQSVSIRTPQATTGDTPDVWIIKAWHGSGSGQLIDTIQTVSLDGNTTFAQLFPTGANTDEERSDAWQAAIDTLVPDGKSATVTVSTDDQGAEGIVVITANYEITHVSLTFPAAATGFYTIERLQRYGSGAGNEFQLVNQVPNMTLTFGGETTSAIPSIPRITGIKTALESLSGISPGDITLHYPEYANNGGVLVEFTGSLAGQDQPTMEANNGGSVIPIADGTGLNNQISSVIVNADGGTFTLTVNGSTTAAINYGASASTVQSAINAALGANDVEVTGAGTAGNPYLIEGVNGLEQTAFTVTADASGLTGGADGDVVVAIAGDPGQNELQRLTVDDTTTGGTMRLAYGGEWTDSIAYPFTASAVESALEALSGIGSGNVDVSGTTNGPFLIEFTGALAETNVPLLSVDVSELTISGSGAMELDQTQFATGPSWYNEPRNWSLGHIPRSGEVICFRDSPQDCLYGLRQRSTFSVAANSPSIHLSGADFEEGQIVHLRTSGSFPSATKGGSGHTISSSTPYYIVSWDQHNQTAVISDAEDGTPIVFTSTGSGTHTMEVRAQQIVQYQQNSGRLGAGFRDDDGRWQDRNVYLSIGLVDVDDGEWNLLLGVGEGGGTSRFWIDAGESELRARIINSGSGDDDHPAIAIQVDNSTDTVVELLNGELGLAILPGTTSSIGKLVQHGGTYFAGDVTITSVDRTAGSVVRLLSTDGDVLALNP
jgi:hypothetical protein